MKKYLFSLAAVLMLLPMLSMAQNTKNQYSVYGVAFYNLENLFDTIPNNPLGRDAEYTPAGQNAWGSRKYWAKIHNLAYAISQMTTQTTPGGPAIIGVSEIENRSVLDDLVKDPAIKS